MADFFKGLAGGMQTGLQFGEAIRKRRMEDELAQAYAKPETSQGYTAETGQQLEELAKTGAYDIVPQYAPAAEGQTQGVFTGYQAVPKAGLDLQGDVPAAPMAFNPQQVQDYGGRRVAGQFDPTQLRGLQMQEAARVLGSYGDVRGAAALETQADELRRGLARDKREEAAEADRVARRPLEIKQLENALVSQGLTIAEAQRVAAEQVSISSAREKLQTLRKDGPLTAAIISNVAGEFKLDPTKFLQAEDAVNTLEIKDLKRDLSKAAMGGDTTFNNFLAAKFDPDKTDNITPKVTKAKDGSFVVMYGDRVLPEYGTHKNMMSLVGGVINMIDQNPFATLTTLSTLDKNAAAIEESKAGTKLKNAQAGAVGLEKLSPLSKPWCWVPRKTQLLRLNSPPLLRLLALTRPTPKFSKRCRGKFRQLWLVAKVVKLQQQWCPVLSKRRKLVKAQKLSRIYVEGKCLSLQFRLQLRKLVFRILHLRQRQRSHRRSRPEGSQVVHSLRHMSHLLVPVLP